MKVHPAPQGSEDWEQVRKGKPTGSQMSNIIRYDKRKKAWCATRPDTWERYRCTLLAQWAGVYTEGPPSFWMQHGTDHEDQAVGEFELLTGMKCEPVGFVLSDCERYGCSPDRLIEGGGLECKCPAPETHIRYLLDGQVPEQYIPQIYTCMFICGADRWEFFSYYPGIKPLHVTVTADNDYGEFCVVLSELLPKFLDELEHGKAVIGEVRRLDWEGVA